MDAASWFWLEDVILLVRIHEWSCIIKGPRFLRYVRECGTWYNHACQCRGNCRQGISCRMSSVLTNTEHHQRTSSTPLGGKFTELRGGSGPLASAGNQTTICCRICAATSERTTLHAHILGTCRASLGKGACEAAMAALPLDVHC